MNNLTFPEGIQLKNIRQRAIPCHCEAHLGEVVKQIDAQLPDGRPIAILQDWRGFHLAIGDPKALGQHPYNQPVSRGDIMQKLLEAMK